MSVCKPFGRPRERAFSLVELMAAMTLMGTFVVAVYGPFTVGLRLVDSTSKRGDVHQQLVNTLDLLTREASLASNIDAAQDQRLQFDADLDGNGTTEGNINYRVQAGVFERVFGGRAVTLITNLAAIDINYLDQSGAAMATPVGAAARDNIRVVQITATATKDGETISTAGAVFLRNQ